MSSNQAPLTDEDLVIVENVMKATGLTHAEAVQLLLMDDALDDACDAALSNAGLNTAKA